MEIKTTSNTLLLKIIPVSIILSDKMMLLSRRLKFKSRENNFNISSFKKMNPFFNASEG